MSEELSKALNVLVGLFLDKKIGEFEIDLNGLSLNENEFKDLKDLIRSYVGSNNDVVHNDEVVDKYTYDSGSYVSVINPEICTKYIRKLVLVYRIRGDEYILYYVRGFYEETDVDCNKS